MPTVCNKLFWIGSMGFSKKDIQTLEKDFIIQFAETCYDCLAIQQFDPSLIVMEEPFQNNSCLFCKNLQNRQRFGHIPIIYIAVSCNEQKKMILLKHGIYFVLKKPCAIRELHLISNNIISTLRQFSLKLNPGHENTIPLIDPFYKKVLEIIYEHLSDTGFRCEQLAELMCVNRITLYKKLKKACQQSPIELIHYTRLQKAKEKITAQEGNIKQIAHAVGFNSVNYFRLLFKKQFGVRPSVLK